jgi:hypothetical protein
MAHGGSLTINPETGLPEAGFLSSLLPMAIGFGLAPFTGGMSAALITGAGYTAATGSLKKGIMAGLGAYGGAGLGAGLSSLGTTAVAPAVPAATAVTPGLTSSVAANTSALAGTSPLANVGNAAVSSVDDIFLQTAKANPYVSTTAPGMTSATLNQTPVYNIAQYPNSFIPKPVVPPTSAVVSPASSGDFIGDVATKNFERQQILANQGAINPTVTKQNLFSTFNPPRVTPSNAVDLSQSAAPTVSNTAGQTVSRPFSDYMSQVGRGAKTAFSSTDGLKALYSAAEAAAPYSGVASLGSTAMNYMEDKREKAEEEMRKRQAAMNTGMIRPYEFNYGATGIASEPYFGSAERTYFQPTYTAGTPYKAPGPEYAAEGGLMGLAVGGPVEQMAAMNAVGANTGYPQANLQTPMYSNPAMQRPQATNVIAPSADAGVDTYTGEARFAKGGDTGPPDTRPFFNPNTTGKSAEDYTRSELAGGRRAPIATPAAAPTNQYTYDPQTMQFTQGGANGAVTGGIAQPGMQAVKQPTNPAQPLIPNINIPAYQTPEQQLGLGGFYDYMNQQMGGYAGYAAGGGVSHLGDYSDGGRLLKGPGDGVSDSIPASIGNRQPARLADGEFVVPARIVSEIGNGSTEAGARKLYAMMDRVQRARKKTTGKNQVAANTKADKLLPA